MKDKAEGQSDVPLSDLVVSATRGRPADLVAYPEPGEYGPPAVTSAVSRVSPLTLLLRRKWLILGVFVLVAGASVPCIWLFFAPSYRATAVVRISPVIEPIVFKNEKSGVLPFYQSFVNTEVSVIYSPTVLERVLDRPEVTQTDWFQQGSKNRQVSAAAMVERLQKSLNVSPRTGTELIDVSITTGKPRDAKTIVDIVVSEYRKLKEEIDKMSDTQLAETLRTEQEGLQLEIDGLIKTRFNISSRLGTDAPEQLRSKLSQQLSDMEAELQKLEREQQMVDWQLKLAAQVETMPADGPDRRYAMDATWQQLYFDLERTRSELAVARQQYGELNPKIKQAVAKAELGERLLAERQNQLDEAWQTDPGAGVAGDARPRESLKQRSDQLDQQRQLLKKDLEVHQKKVKEAGDIALDIANYDEKIRQKRELYEAVRSRRDVLEMEGKAPARVRVAAYAPEPSAPANDRRVLLSLLAMAGAAGFSVTVGYLRSLADKRIYDVKELQHISQVPFLGMLPKLSMANLPKELGGVSKGEVPVTADGNSRLMLMENMRMVRTTLLERVSQTGEKVVLITSSLPNTGKSSVAVLLAQSLAVVGKKVLLVEADLRRPVLEQRFGIAPGKGLASLLVSKGCDNDAVIRPESARFDMVPAGELPDQFDPELLANGVFAACMERWRKKYDFILLDSPPLLRVADAQILASSADGTIMVLRSSHDRRNETMEALSQLTAVGGTLLGTVLIGGQSGIGYGGEYGYSYYGGYGRSYADNGEGKRALTAGTNGSTERST